MNTAQYAELFLTEGREHLSAVNHALLVLERAGGAADGASSGAASDAIATIFRAVHTVKGMSATMGYAAVAELSHELETLLDRMRRGELAPSQDVTDVLFAAADCLERGIELSAAGRADDVDAARDVARLRALSGSVPIEAEHAAAFVEWSAPVPPGSGVVARVRLMPDTPLKGVRAHLVVEALRKLGEVTGVSPAIDALQSEQFDRDFAVRLETAAASGEIERAARSAGDVDAVQVQPAAADSRVGGGGGAGAEPVADAANRSVRVDARRLDALMNLVGELVTASGRLQRLSAGLGSEALNDEVERASRLVGELRDEIVKSRLVPVEQVFDRFPRLVRDAARALSKQIEFTMEGKRIELDRSMLDEIGEPIVHLLRNAVDHGIEPPDVRLAAGKPAAGRLLLSASRDRNAVAIRVSDDGRGIDRERVAARARETGLLSATHGELTDDDLLRLIAKPGFSTAERVTDLSGRGVGIDAVLVRVRQLGGSVDVRSVSGRGTTVTIRLPLTLAIVRAILARVDSEQYAIPTTHIRETVEVHPENVSVVRGREVLMLREDVLPLIRLRSVVRLPEASLPELEQAVVFEVAEKRAALVVDDLLGQQDIVVKRMDHVRDGLRCFSGATILTDGAPALILDVGSLS